MNKYNVRAIRKDLDGFIRNRSWNKFYSKLKSLESNPELLKAVVLSKSKQCSGTMLHAVVRHNSSCHSSILPSVKCLVNSVPESLLVQDNHLETPLHIAIGICQCLDMIKLFLEIANRLEQEETLVNSQQPTPCNAIKNANILTMIDRNGDTPLLKASRMDASVTIRLLLQYAMVHDEPQTFHSLLVERKPRGRTALWHVASNELQHVNRSKDYVVPKDLKFMLMATFFALQRRKATSIDEEELNVLSRELTQEANEVMICSAVAPGHLDIHLTIRALVSCGHLLGKYAVKLFDYMLANEIYRDVILSQEIDRDRNFTVHCLCSCEILQSTNSITATTSAISTNVLLVEQLLRQDGIELALLHPNQQGNTPLHLALASQKCYCLSLMLTCPAALRHQNHRGELPLHIVLKSRVGYLNTSAIDHIHLIRRLWQQYPGAVLLRDRSTQLFPFQLAASRDWGQQLENDTTSNSDENDAGSQLCAVETTHDAWLTLIFSFLLAAPQLIK